MAEDADDPWEIQAELERLLPHDSVPWTPWPSHEVRPPDLPGGYDPVRVAAAVLAAAAFPSTPNASTVGGSTLG